jgi:hypothetical protein
MMLYWKRIRKIPDYTGLAVHTEVLNLPGICWVTQKERFWDKKQGTLHGFPFLMDWHGERGTGSSPIKTKAHLPERWANVLFNLKEV